MNFTLFMYIVQYNTHFLFIWIVHTNNINKLLISILVILNKHILVWAFIYLTKQLKELALR